jgi:zinc transport system substrate-binding protein
MLKARVAEGDIVCVFSEPQFDAGEVAVVSEAAGLRTAVLDPMGAHLEPGPQFYAALLRDMAARFVGCLSGS